MKKSSFIRESADVRRQALIDAAIQCLAELGVAGTSVRAICARAGVSPGLLTHYFEGIDALILAAYHDVGARVARAIEDMVAAAGANPRARLEAYVCASFRPPVLDADLLATWIAFWSLIKARPDIAQAHAAVYGGYRAEMESLIAACVPDMPQKERHLAAVGISALVDGLWLELCLDSSQFSPEDATAMAQRWIAELIDK